MKVLWVNSNFMHPINKGGQIRTFEMLRYLHRWHEIHYVAIQRPAQPEGPARAHEYSTKSYPFPARIPEKTSLSFLPQLIGGLFSSVPLSMSRFNPPGMRAFLADLIRRERFDVAVADHLAPMTYFPDRAHCVLFQHNVEFMIWRRRVQHAADALRRAYFRQQADRMFAFERDACREAGCVVACSEVDARLMRESFSISNVTHVPTGVNIEHFTPPELPSARTSRPDLVFVGSMDWQPNEEGVLWFAKEILPLVRRRRPGATFAVVGRTPPPSIQALARDSNITVTGTVPEVRPWFWESGVSIVPLRIGGGTRLKIYEAMAARSPVVSTTIGAEGLEYSDGEHLRIADTPEAFAEACIDLIENPRKREVMIDAAHKLVTTRFSWEVVARRFDEILQKAPRLP